MKITKPMKLIRDNKDNSTFNALDFGGPKIYKINGAGVYAPEGGTNITHTNTEYTLEPLGLKIPRETEGEWEIISHQDIGTCDWRITVKNTITGEEHSGVYPFNSNGHVYQLECGGEWVMASCGGYEIQTGSGDLCYTLLGTGETIRINMTWGALDTAIWTIDPSTHTFTLRDLILDFGPLNINIGPYPIYLVPRVEYPICVKPADANKIRATTDLSGIYATKNGGFFHVTGYKIYEQGSEIDYMMIRITGDYF